VLERAVDDEQQRLRLAMVMAMAAMANSISDDCGGGMVQSKGHRATR